MGWSLLAASPDADEALFPGADQIVSDLASPALTAAAAGGNCYVVVATMGDYDEASIRAALTLSPAYLGVVASSKRFAQMRQTLIDGGTSAAALDAIQSPAGISIGAVTPEEIALSVLAEIVERQRAARPVASPQGAAERSSVAPATATDPICGMTVDVASARHTAEHAGRTWYFCCGGCRERFLAAPQSFSGRGAA
jgi:xanthine dehydrogenase accessory factor